MKEELKINWVMKLLLKLSPNHAMKYMARKMRINNVVFDEAHELFSKIERIDFFPTTPGNRGFVLIFDLQTAIYFHQDGDHFAYDGFEMGEYEKGDVTIFDRIKR